MKPQSVLGQVRGFARDLALDSLPKGVVWDLKDIVVERRGVRLESRGAWGYHTAAYGTPIFGGRFIRFAAGDRLLVVADGNLNEVNIPGGSSTPVGALFASVVQNGVKLRDRVYFMDGAGIAAPIGVSWNGSAYAFQPTGSGAPAAKVGCAYKDRLVLAKGSDVYFSPLETEPEGGPLYGPFAPWDPRAKIGVSSEAYGVAPMANQLLVFHAKSVSKVVGGIPPETGVDSDMGVATLTDGAGCTMPHTICNWNENVLWADERGVFITEGATVRNLTEQGGISDFWREAYALRVPGPSVCMQVFYDYLLVSILTTGTTVPFFLICDLTSRGWTRFTNFPATCMIAAEGLNEEVYAGHQGSNRLVRVSPMFSEPLLGSAVNPKPSTIDGNGIPVLPVLETGWMRMGEEGRKQIRSIYASYRHQEAGESPPIDADSVRVSYRVDPLLYQTDAYVEAGTLPSVGSYTRKRVPVGKQCYGLQVKIEAIRPFAWFRIMDLALEGQVLDRGRVTA